MLTLEDKKTAAGAFSFVSMMYLLFFYFIPLALIEKNDLYLYYGGFSFHFGRSQVNLAWASGGIFLVTMVAANKFFSGQSLRFAKRPIESMRFSLRYRAAWYAFVFATLISAFVWNDPNLAYQVRSGEMSGSRARLLVIIFINFSGTFFFCGWDSIGRYKTATVCAGLLFAFNIFLVNGRFFVMLSFLMLIIALFRANLTRKKYYTFWFLGFLCVLPVILVLKSALNIILLGGDLEGLAATLDAEGIENQFIMNFAHPVISTLIVERIVDESGYRYFSDVIQGFLFYLKLIGYDAGESYSFANTNAILGINASIVPPGFIAFGYAQLSYVGVFILALFYAYIGYLCAIFAFKYFPDSRSAPFVFALLSGNTFYQGEMRSLILSFFMGTLLVFVLARIVLAPSRR